MEFSQELRNLIIAIARKVANAFIEAFRKLCEWITENWEWIRTEAMKCYLLEEEKNAVIRHRHKPDFIRKKFSHQVTDRRPHFAVRKIIR